MARAAAIVAIIAVLSGNVSAAQDEDLPGLKARSEFQTGQVLVTTIPLKAFEDSPRWLATDPNPPLSARKAISLAENTKRKAIEELKLPDEPNYEWVLSEAAIVPRSGDQSTDRWFWEVRYEVRRIGGQTGPPTFVPFYVLMDGTAFEPKLEDQ